MVKSNAFTGGAVAGLTSTENIVMAAGKGIDFSANANAPGTTSEVLNDYEVGIYTATMTPSTSGTIELNSTGDTLAYVKVGQIVHIHGMIYINDASSPVGTYVEVSLPFAIADLTELAERFGNCSTYLDFSTGLYSLLPIDGQSGSVFRVYMDASTIGTVDQWLFSFSYSTIA
jgi:hypothetical protein